MEEKLLAIKAAALAELDLAADPEAVKELRVKYLGKKSPMTEILRGMGKLSPEERPKIGQIVNLIKAELTAAMNAKGEELEEKALAAKLAEERWISPCPAVRRCGGISIPSPSPCGRSKRSSCAWASM